MRVESTVRPDPSAAATYASLQPVFAELYYALAPTFTTLRRLAPGLPFDLPEGSRPGGREAGTVGADRKADQR